MREHTSKRRVASEQDRSTLGALIHAAVRGAIEAAVEAELAAALGAGRYERRAVNGRPSRATQGHPS